MSCFSCFASKTAARTRSLSVGRSLGTIGFASTINQHQPAASPPRQQQQQQQRPRCNCNQPEEGLKAPALSNNTAEETFSFRELATATKNFRQECLIGEGLFGIVYKGKLEKTGQIVAVKQLDRNGLQGNKEFLNEVDMLSLLHHENLVNLIGHCADGDQRLLVYEYMPLGSLEDHLLDLTSEQEPLNWSTRMKIALEAAKGLEYLHYKANPPVIYRDLKSSNILLDEGYNVKLSDFGLAKKGPVGDKSHVSTVVRGTYGYCAPEYQRTGHLTLKSDVYSFGIVLLELITGRRAIEITLPVEEQCIVSWAQPIFKDKTRFTELADPLLEGEFPSIEFDQAIAVAAMCLQENPSSRPLISDVVEALSFLGAEHGATSHSNLSSISANGGGNYTEDSISGASYASSRSGSSSHHSIHLHGN